LSPLSAITFARALSWNEIRQNAIAFSKEWEGEKREQAEKQTFRNESFAAFGIRCRVVATFEEPVEKISGKYGFIDLFWPGVEHKSFDEDLGKAQSQAKRQGNLDETLAAFPWVNGELFAENLGFADFNHTMRDALLACTNFDWSRISPAIFGSLFQAVMEPRERRQVGGHYTSERDILKVIRSLFLDDLRAELERGKNNRAELKRFHERVANLHFFDPACGCGNFLVITYRELRLLEIEVLRLIHRADASVKANEVSDCAGLWMRVDVNSRPFVLDNTADRSIKGSVDWHGVSGCSERAKRRDGYLFWHFGEQIRDGLA
jgi:hypothetical protein